jgi:hypothetical protein
MMVYDILSKVGTLDIDKTNKKFTAWISELNKQLNDKDKQIKELKDALKEGCERCGQRELTSLNCTGCKISTLLSEGIEEDEV